MHFNVDKQTLQELNLLGRYRPDSIFSIFNHTVTRGATTLLEQHFNSPLSESHSIEERSNRFQFFYKNSFTLPFSSKEYDSTEQYVDSASATNPLLFLFTNIKQKLFSVLSIDKEHLEIVKEQRESVKVIKEFIELTHSIATKEKSEELLMKLSNINQKKKRDLLKRLEQYNPTDNSFINFLKLDYLLRYKNLTLVREILESIEEVDLYITVARVGRERQFNFAKLLPQDENRVEVKGVYHPSIPNAVSNDLLFNQEKNVLFLTGANMAGKSTLMKAFGISIYLAHMGYPAPFSSMEFSPATGLSTSINVADNLDMGYSHFYAEVVRVKEIALKVAENRRVSVMFDELFKGTNVKDAHEATVKITSAFAKKRRCSFIISTHIMEAGEELTKSEESITFKFLPSTLVGSQPKYSYLLQDGISDDRHGMTIIKNEKIVEIIAGDL
ncbi:MAG: hypothetical protein WC960_00760 [Bacteroidales bacterium]